MNRIPLANRAIALPLIGLLVAWLSFMGATLANLYVPQPQYGPNGNVFFKEEIFQVAPYLFLLGIAAVAVASLLAQGLAIKAREQSQDSSSLARAAHRLTAGRRTAATLRNSRSRCSISLRTRRNTRVRSSSVPSAAAGSRKLQ